MNNLLAQYNVSAEAFVSALGACHRSLTPQNVTQLEASQARYRREAQRLEAAMLDTHPLEQLGVSALLSAQVGASQGIAWHFRSKLIRQDSEAAALAGDQESAKKLEAEADAIQCQVEDLADGVFAAQDLAEVIGGMMPMGEVRQ